MKANSAFHSRYGHEGKRITEVDLAIRCDSLPRPKTTKADEVFIVRHWASHQLRDVEVAL